MIPAGTIGNIQELLDALRATDRGTTRWFRGHSNADWFLQPSAARNRGWLTNEANLIKRFKQDSASRVRTRPGSEWEWVCLAQHHAVPTRLLDWTENPLVGLYFSVERDADENGNLVDGSFYAMEPGRLNARSNPGGPAVLLLGDDLVCDNFLPGAGSPKRDPLAVVAPRSFERIVAQSGVFSVSHASDFRPVNETEPAAFDMWTVPITAKEAIRNTLRLFNIDASSVYPDLAHLGERLKEEFRT